MGVKFSEMIAVRSDLALSLEAGFDRYCKKIAGGYGDYLAPALADGETPIDTELQLVLLRRRVERHRLELLSLDVGVLEQTHGDDKVRAELEKRRDAVDGKMRLMRHACRGIYGLEALPRVGLSGEFPRGPVRLHSQAVVVKTSLENPDLGLEPKLKLDFGKGKGKSGTAQLAAQLEPELSELGELVDDRHNERKKSTDLRLERQELIREFDYNIRAVVRMCQGMFRLAGRSDLARRMRPILQRVIRKLNEEQAKEDAEAAADASPDTDGAESAATDEAAAPEETTA